MTLPPLPPERSMTISPRSGYLCVELLGYSKSDIVAYGEACAAAERERIALWLKDNYQDYATIAGIADAIRGQS